MVVLFNVSHTIYRIAAIINFKNSATIMKTKKIATAIYVTLCFFLATGQPKDDANSSVWIGWFLFLIGNFCIAAYLTNKVFKNDTTTNGNRIQKRAD